MKFGGCIQSMVNWYTLYTTDTNSIYRFGDKTEKFSQEMDSVFSKEGSLEDAGRVIDKYLPEYIPSCMRYHEPIIQACHKYLENDLVNFKECVSSHDKEFKELITAWLLSETMANNNVADFGHFNYESFVGSQRKMLQLMAEQKQKDRQRMKEEAEKPWEDKVRAFIANGESKEDKDNSDWAKFTNSIKKLEANLEAIDFNNFTSEDANAFKALDDALVDVLNTLPSKYSTKRESIEALKTGLKYRNKELIKKAIQEILN